MATIGIDVTALWTASSGGIGTSQYQTMRALAGLGTSHRFVMYAARPPVIPYTDRPLDLPWPLRLGSGPLTRSNIIWMQTGANNLLAADGVDLVWSPRHLLPLRVRRVARVATIQDLWHLHLPEQQPWPNRVANRLLIRRIMQVADHLVMTSQATADDAVEHYGVSPERISVVPLGVDHEVFTAAPESEVEAVRARLGLDGPYLLSLDVFNARKNFRAALHAFASLAEAEKHGVTLVGLGRPRATAADADPRGLANALGVSDSVRLVDDVSTGELVALYSGAAALVYPSVYEGFGMPILEAMACGCPVISSNRASLPEVTGDAGLLVEPEDVSALAHAMRRVLTDAALAHELRERGRCRSAEFTWERTARGMLAVFEHVLEGKG
jgi:glycosyltransferase involved in cell wall biosynthesis